MEKKYSASSSLIGIIPLIMIFAFVFYQGVTFFDTFNYWDLGFGVVGVIVFFIIVSGFSTLEPNGGIIVQYLGVYQGTIRETGLFFMNPFMGRKYISFKVHNYAMKPLRVTDSNGVPIEIAAIIVWRCQDSYKYNYDVDNITSFIDNQFDIALREHARKHTYTQLSCEDKDFIADVTEKVSKAGIEILDAKITHLNYAPEIAASMLQKQHAQALSEAKQIIVDNAAHIANEVSMKVKFDNSQDRAKFASNLIIVLCSDRGVNPVLNI